MTALWLASVVCTLATMVLNAHYGWSTSNLPFYAGMMAALSVAFDVAKSTLLLAASKAWRNQAYAAAVLCFLLFWPFLAYSIHAGVAQVAKDRGASTAAATYDLDQRARVQDEQKRIASAFDVTLQNSSSVS